MPNKKIHTSFWEKLILQIILLVMGMQGAALAQERPDAKKILTLEDTFFDSAVTEALTEAIKGNVKELDVLEAVAAEARSTKIRMMTGSWKLAVLYDQTFADPNSPDFQALLARWTARWPKSPTPYILMAQAMLTPAKKSHWTELRGLPDPRNHTIKLDALKELQAFLQKIQSFAEHDPQWSVLSARVRVMIESDEASEQSTAAFKDFVLKAIEREPTYDELYSAGTFYFLQKWNGQADNRMALEEWAQAAAAAGKSAGVDGGYARVYWHAHRYQYGRMLFDWTNADWTRLKASGNAYIAEHKESGNAMRMAFLACLAGDRNETKRLITLPGRHRYLGETAGIDVFKVCDAWAQAPAWSVTLENAVQWLAPQSIAAFYAVRYDVRTNLKEAQSKSILSVLMDFLKGQIP